MAEDMRTKLAPLSKRVEKARNKGESWADIAVAEGITPGKAMLAFEFSQVDEGDIVTARNEEELGKKIAKMRDNESLSWGKISARCNIGEQKARSLYEDATGTSTKGNRIGKGGRYPSEGGGTPKKVTGVKKVTKKAAPKKVAVAKKATGRAPAKKAAAAKKVAGVKKASKAASTEGSQSPASRNGSSLADLDLEGLQNRLEGRKIGVARSDSDKLAMIAVRKVVSLENGELQLIADNGNTRTVLVENIKRATK